MAQTKQFEAIIRRVNKEIFPKRNSEKRIIIDNATQKAIDKTSLFFGTYTYYIVTNSTGIRNVNFASSVFPITDDRSRKINISVDCQISCAPGNEVKLAESLHQNDTHPGNKLDEFIEQWLLEFVQDDPANFIDNFFQKRDSLIAAIIQKAKHQLGLDFQAVRCLIEGENLLETIHLTLEKTLLRFKDSVQEHSFTADVTLLIDSQNKINAIARRKSKTEFEEIIKKHLREFFFNQVRIENIYSNHEAVENDFKQHTAKLLQHYGRQIGAILLKDNDGSQGKPLSSLEKKITVELEVPEYHKKVEVENQIFITRVNAAKYNANKPEDFEKWLKENVERVVKQAYFGRRYYEIIEQRDDLENKVKINFKNLIEGLGYSLDHIIVTPTFDEIKGLKKIIFDIDEKFVTRDQQEVRLKISVKAEGNEQSPKITPYLNNIQVLPREMRTLVMDEIKQYLRFIRSEEFYVNFDDEENPQKTVKNNLVNLIRNKLSQIFDAKANYLSFDIGETEVIERIDELKKQSHQLEIEIKSVVDGGVNIFSISFKVENIIQELWLTFQTQKFDTENIKTRIIESLTARLSSLHSSRLNYRDEKSRIDIEKLIREISFDAVKTSFGLYISVRDVYRKATPMNPVLKKLDENLQHLMLEKIAVLTRGDFDEADEIDEKIKRLEESINDPRLNAPIDKKTLLPTKTTDGNGSTNDG